MKYQADDLIDYENDSPVFDTLDEALEHVRKHFSYTDRPAGIWTSPDDGGELVAIFHMGELFTR